MRASFTRSFASTVTDEEREVLDHYAASNGRQWKRKLYREWENGTSAFSQAYPNSAAVLQRLRNASYFGPRGLEKYRSGKPITDFDARLERYLASASLVRWEHIYSAGIPGTGRTLWQSWVFVDGSAPASLTAGFSSYPDAFTLRRATKAAREGRVPADLGRLLHSRSAAVPRREAPDER